MFTNEIGTLEFTDPDAGQQPKRETAADWGREYDDFMAAYRRAARRDVKTDPHGHAYVPIRMDGQDTPQRGQWAFCHAVYPGTGLCEGRPPGRQHDGHA